MARTKSKPKNKVVVAIKKISPKPKQKQTNAVAANVFRWAELDQRVKGMQSMQRIFVPALDHLPTEKQMQPMLSQFLQFLGGMGCNFKAPSLQRKQIKNKVKNS